MKPGKKRIMIQVWGAVDKALKRDFRALHIKRDSYLNSLLGREIENLDKEVEIPNLDAVYQRLLDRPLPNRQKLTLELDEKLVNRIAEVLRTKKIPRDSFVNRVLFFLLASDLHLNALGIEYERQTRVEGKPLDDAWGFLNDPFYAIRVKNSDQFYTIACFADGPFGTNGPNLFSLNTAISEDVWDVMNMPQEDLVDLLGLPPKEN
ncbi:MAG: hypothetical protein NT159_18415 [Proteobacteria bacterium]|nr:hypothetical protein [Pseudomonadota bacterium]